MANRTLEIFTAMKSSQWFHVASKENPADCASRGLFPSSLLITDMWFSRPSFLRAASIGYKRTEHYSIDLEQFLKAHITTLPDVFFIFRRYSLLTKLVRIVAYCRRFLNKHPKGQSLYLQKTELDAALKCCIRKHKEKDSTQSMNNYRTNTTYSASQAH